MASGRDILAPMRDREHIVTRVPVRGPALLAAAALLAGCGGDAPRNPAPPAATPAPPAATADPASPAVPPLAPSGTEITVRPDWPPGWKELESGRAGPDGLPLVWFRLDAGHAAPPTAVAQALSSLRPHAGTIAVEDITTAQDGRSIGQVRGARLAAAIVATPRDGRTEVRVTLEPGP